MFNKQYFWGSQAHNDNWKFKKLYLIWILPLQVEVQVNYKLQKSTHPHSLTTE